MWTNTEAIAGKQNKENDAANVGTTLSLRLANRAKKSSPLYCLICHKVTCSEMAYTFNMFSFCTENCLCVYLEQYQYCKKCNKCISLSNIAKYSITFGSEFLTFCSLNCYYMYKAENHYCVLCKKVSDVFVLSLYESLEYKFCSTDCKAVYFDRECPEFDWDIECSVCSKRDILARTSYKLHDITFCGKSCAETFFNEMKIHNARLCIVCQEYVADDGKNFIDDFCCSNKCLGVLKAVTRNVARCEACATIKYDYNLISIPKLCTNVCSINCLLLMEANSKPVLKKCPSCNQNKILKYYVTKDAKTIQVCSHGCFNATKDFAIEEVPQDNRMPNFEAEEEITLEDLAMDNFIEKPWFVPMTLQFMQVSIRPISKTLQISKQKRRREFSNDLPAFEKRCASPPNFDLW